MGTVCVKQFLEPPEPFALAQGKGMPALPCMRELIEGSMRGRMQAPHLLLHPEKPVARRPMQPGDALTVDHTAAFMRCGCGRWPLSSCDRCGKLALLKTCGGCGREHYCGAECQKAAWGEHKGMCRARKEHPAQ